MVSRAATFGNAAARAASVRTYADFQAHIATLATNGDAAWASAVPTSGTNFRTTAAAATGTMTGSTWGPSSSRGVQRSTTATCRAIQHALPSSAAFNAQVAAGRDIYFQTVTGAAQTDLEAVTRNGFTSSAASGSFSSPGKISILIYWDGVEAQWVDPIAGTGPTPYSF